MFASRLLRTLKPRPTSRLARSATLHPLHHRLTASARLLMIPSRLASSSNESDESDEQGRRRVDLFKSAGFSSAKPMQKFVKDVKATLDGDGRFNMKNLLPTVSGCRDELATPLLEELTAAFDSPENSERKPFVTSSLAGMLFCGKTGFSAALHHLNGDGLSTGAPGCFAHFGFAHIGLNLCPGAEPDPWGTVHRYDMVKSSGACGALVGVKKSLDDPENNPPPSDVRHDLEQTELYNRVKGALQGDTSMVNLTKLTETFIWQDMLKSLRQAASYDTRMQAVWTGVHIHVSYINGAGDLEIDHYVCEMHHKIGTVQIICTP